MQWALPNPRKQGSYPLFFAAKGVGGGGGRVARGSWAGSLFLEVALLKTKQKTQTITTKKKKEEKKKKRKKEKKKKKKKKKNETNKQKGQEKKKNKIHKLKLGRSLTATLPRFSSSTYTYL